jgi:hypothetical protein
VQLMVYISYINFQERVGRHSFSIGDCLYILLIFFVLSGLQDKSGRKAGRNLMKLDYNSGFVSVLSFFHLLWTNISIFYLKRKWNRIKDTRILIYYEKMVENKSPALTQSQSAGVVFLIERDF